MAIDLPHLQLIFNVIAITGLTSLAAICTMLKRDNQKLTMELRNQDGDDPDRASAPENDRIAPYTALASGNENIRQYVSRRIPDWVEIQKTATKA
jgi:hypothetical protein